MRRRIDPLAKVGPTEEEAKAKVALVLQVLSGEKSIAEACRETGLKGLGYYKLEERLVAGMLAAAKMPAARKGRRPRDPAAEANLLEQETQELRREHQRMSALVRISKKLFRTQGRGGKKGPGRPPKVRGEAPVPSTPEETAPPPASRRRGRPPSILKGAPHEERAQAPAE